MELIDDKKGIYKDGHERKDVKARRKEYCDKMMNVYLPNTVQYSGDDMSVQAPAANPSGPKYVICKHDETIVATNEANGRMWAEGGNQDQMHKKTKGKP